MIELKMKIYSELTESDEKYDVLKVEIYNEEKEINEMVEKIEEFYDRTVVYTFEKITAIIRHTRLHPNALDEHIEISEYNNAQFARSIFTTTHVYVICSVESMQW
ncbi:hypothetical protein [Bacillus safensis]|uniref:hypothetical protein n=1 Tax=Bacillus safensis TaxID=561879 RepID=UPI0020CC849C|nr:hypothetical protein [Bacillus safensis]MCP9283612.1 hypothetical protein [Bacillus safensis]